MFQVGEIVWHPKFKRGEVAQSVGTDVRVMFDDTQWNPRITTQPASPGKKKDVAERFKGNLNKGIEESTKELDEELKDSTLTLEEQVEYRREKQRQKAKDITFEEEANREVARKSPLDGHTIYWAAEGYQQPVDRQGLPDPRYVSPVTPGYLRVEKTTHPMIVFVDKETGEKRFIVNKDRIDLKLVDNKTGKKYLVQIDSSYNPELSVARKVPYEELSLLMDDNDSFGGFSSQPKQ